MFRTVLAFVFVCGTAVSYASSEAPASCKPPSWAPAALAGYQLDSCVHRAWDVVDFDAPDGTKHLEGDRVDVVYTLVDDAKNVTTKQAWQHFVDAAQQAGAKLMSEKAPGFQAYLERKTATADEWFAYIHGSGNDESTGSFTLRTVTIRPLAQEVKAKVDETPWSATTCADPPWLVQQFAYFKRGECTDRDFDSVTFATANGDKVIAGRVLEVNYDLADEDKEPTPIAVYRNYVAALKAIGATQVSSPDHTSDAVFSQKTPKGEYWYMYSQAAGNEDSESAYKLVAVEVGAPPATQCTLEAYGVNFDTDQSALRPDADPVLQQLLKLFQQDPTYAAEISGHTDDVGEAAHNLTLSQDRAGAVKAWLVAHGVAATRMTTAGFGATKPLVPNSNDANRAKNRRVELTRKNCK
jgi:outer membrane protein OmpA-like peptidoglycan-associated protein